MRLKPFFGYFGSKWRLAKKYPAPQEQIIVEPFAGSANYAMLYPEKTIVLFDLDQNVVDVWRYLIETPEKDILALPDIEIGQSVEDLDVPKAARLLIGFWLGSGLAQPNKTVSAWMKNKKYFTKCQWWGEGVRQRIASQQRHIRHWRVIQKSYTACANIPATYFVDPPYQVKGTSYTHSSTDIDYQELSAWCQARKGQVIACENEGATWLPFKRLCKIHGTTKKSVEVVWSK